MNATQKRLKNAEVAVGASDAHSVRLEYYDVSLDGEMFPCPEPHRMPHGPVNPGRVLKMCFELPRSEYGRAKWEERLRERERLRKLAEEKAEA